MNIYKTLAAAKSIPRYLIFSHHTNSPELTVLMFIHFTLCREPIRIQADFPAVDRAVLERLQAA